MDQLNAFDTWDAPRARTSDPVTSKEAAKSVRAVRASHLRILAQFRLYGDMTDEQLALVLEDAEKGAGIKHMSPSGVRSRRSELSKPNMDRITEIKQESVVIGAPPTDAVLDAAARRQLRIEGFRSPLWDTGVVDTNAAGRRCIVWGIAK